MLDRARQRVRDRAEFHRADLGDSLDFAADGAFDGVVSALVLDYVADWRRPFSEFSRLLEPGGFLVFSVSHPLDEFDSAADDYFAIERKSKDWDVEIPYYRRPLSEMVDPLVEAGFRIDRIVEPQPTDAFEEKRPDVYETESTHPVFLCVRAVKE